MIEAFILNRNHMVCYGVPVARSLAFAAPGPLCAVVARSLDARLPSSRVAPARFRIRGQGHAMARRVIHQFDIQSFSGVHSVTVSHGLSGQSLTRHGWFFTSFRFSVWTRKSKGGVHAIHVRRNGRSTNIDHRLPGGSMRVPSLCSSFSVSHSSCDPRFVFPSSFVMDNNKKKTEKAADGQTAANGPVKVFVLDDVSASVFAREVAVRGQQRTFYSVSFSRSYRDSSGSRRYVKTFNLEDLGKVVAVAQQADEYIRQQPGVA